MISKKCDACGLVNFGEAEVCKRCGAMLDVDRRDQDGKVESRQESKFEPRRRRKTYMRVFAAPALVLFLLLIAYLSLIITSDPVSFEQRQTINRAIDTLEQKGYTRDAFMLRHVVSFRSTDNWWNRWVGHGDAYAATNFPFQVVTLYPDFFKVPVDDVERAAILLHESYHLFGYRERAAFEGVWRDKRKLGWNREAYGQTHVWKNVREFTSHYAPELFQCGLERNLDCIP